MPAGLAVRSITSAYAGAALAPKDQRVLGAAVALGTARDPSVRKRLSMPPSVMTSLAPHRAVARPPCCGQVEQLVGDNHDHNDQQSVDERHIGIEHCVTYGRAECDHQQELDGR